MLRMTRSFRHGNATYRINISTAERHRSYQYNADVMKVEGRELRTASLYQIAEKDGLFTVYLRGKPIGESDRFTTAIDLIQSDFKANHEPLRRL